tara:strand:- start:8127 stop:8525 length:399 start_codon:yes stop_codon:yes gene_type:complete
MATRSSSNKGVTGRNANVMYAAPNTQDTTSGMIPGLTKGTTYGKGEEIKKQVEITGGLPNVKDLPTPSTKRPMPQVDVFAGTDRKSEPVTAGLPFGPGVGPTEPVADDPDMLLRAIYSVYPDPLLLRLLRIQ